jgi:hypothetical protein
VYLRARLPANSTTRVAPQPIVQPWHRRERRRDRYIRRISQLLGLHLEGYQHPTDPDKAWEILAPAMHVCGRIWRQVQCAFTAPAALTPGMPAPPCHARVIVTAGGGAYSTGPVHAAAARELNTGRVHIRHARAPRRECARRRHSHTRGRLHKGQSGAHGRNL